MVGFSGRNTRKEPTGGLGIEDQRVAWSGGRLLGIGDRPAQAQVLRLEGAEDTSRHGLDGSIEQGDSLEGDPDVDLGGPGHLDQVA